MGREGQFVAVALIASLLLIISPAFSARKIVSVQGEFSADDLADLEDQGLSIAKILPFPKSNMSMIIAEEGVGTPRTGAKRAAARGASAPRKSGRFSIEDDSEVHALMDVSRGLVRVPHVWSSYGLTGANSSVLAIIDTGLDYAHPDVNSTRLAYCYDYISGSSGCSDDNVDEANSSRIIGHGTHVTGTAAGAGIVNSSLKGVAPGSGIASLKVLNHFGNGYVSDIIEALSFISASAPAYNITVASMSLGGSQNSTFDNATNAVAEAGVVVVCAAGNSGPTGQIGSPANASKCITVVALSDSGRLTNYSSIGTLVRYPDIAAPGGSSGFGDGLKINSTMSNFTGDATSYYHELAGTSMAAPHVAGAAQLIIQALAQSGEPWNYTEEQVLKVKMLLLMTATETNQTRENGGNNPAMNRGAADRYEGYGKMNLDAAMEAVLENISANATLSPAFGSLPDGRKAYARRAAVSENETVRFNLSVPPNFDADLYLYSGVPDQYGRPVILANSTSAARGANESVNYTSDANRTIYLVAKFVHAPFRLSNVTPASLSRNIGGSPAQFNISVLNYSEASLIVRDWTGAQMNTTNSSPANYSFNYSCVSNGTLQFTASAYHPGLAEENTTLALDCFDPLGYSFSHNQTFWFNENLSASLNITNIGVENATNVSCSFGAAGEAFFNSSNYTISPGGLINLSAEWNATNTTGGNYSLVFSCAYPGYSSNRTSYFTMENFSAANLTVSNNTTVSFVKGGNFSSGTVRAVLPPYFSLLADHLGGNLTLDLPNATLSGSGEEWLMVSSAAESPNGSTPLASYSVNSSFVPVANYSVSISPAGDSFAFCPAEGCLAGHSEIGGSQNFSPNGSALSGYFVSFVRENVSIENATSPAEATALSGIVVNGTIANSSSEGVPGIVWASVSGSSNYTAANGTGFFSLSLSAPLAGSYAVSLNASFGLSNNATASLPISVPSVCGNGFCEGAESCCSDCGGCVGGGGSSSSSSSGFRLPVVAPPVANQSNRTEPETAAPPQATEEAQATYALSDAADRRIPDPLPGSGISSLDISGSGSGSSLTFGRISAPPRDPAGAIYSAFWINFSGAGVPRASLDFSVPRSFLDSRGYGADAITLARHSGAGWDDLSTELASQNLTHLRYRSAFSGFSLFAIIARETSPPLPEFVAAGPAAGFVEASSSTLGAYDDSPVRPPAAEILSRALFLLSLALSAAALLVGVARAAKK